MTQVIIAKDVFRYKSKPSLRSVKKCLMFKDMQSTAVYKISHWWIWTVKLVI